MVYTKIQWATKGHTIVGLNRTTSMSTVSMQVTVSRTTIQIVAVPDTGMANIFIVDNNDGSHQLQVVPIRQYLRAGTAVELAASHVLELAVAAIERHMHQQTH